jgi:hypothetical protein
MDDENWCAFALAILYCDFLTPEQAFERLACRRIPQTNRFTRPVDADEDVIEMADMREAGMTYTEIGVVFGISKHAVFKRLLRRSKRDCQRPCAIINPEDTGGSTHDEEEIRE